MLDRKTITLTLATAAALLAPLPAIAALKQTATTTTQQPATQPTTATTATTPTTPTTTTPASTTTPAPSPAQTIGVATTPAGKTALPTGAAATSKHAKRNAKAHSASDPSDTIIDYSFSPASITINVGDTVTWTNSGQKPHTATANDGSFDTGTLNHGQSGSHTFSKAGTFAYICTIHPFMHGTIVVHAASTSSASTGGSGSSSGSGSNTNTTATTAGTASTASTASSGSSLPNTGLDIVASTFVGILLLGAGLVIRRRAHADD